MSFKNKDSSKEYIWGKRKNRKWIYIIVAIVVVVGAALGYIVFGLNLNDSSDSLFTTKTKSSQGLERRAIDGVYVPADQANIYPVAVMIENLVSSRPPSGLSKANLVYEALAEGGITRFMAVYAGQFVTMPEIGPVRSARSYYIDWALEYNALYTHVGGSPQAFADIREYSVFDLNQFYSSQYFWRDSERLAPHNLYTSGEKLAFALRDLEADETSDFDSWKFKDEVDVSDRPAEDKSIDIKFSSFNYDVGYKYNKEKNDYLRYQAGEIHIDKDESEIRAKNVAVQKVKTYLIDDNRLGMDTVGEGESIVFRDGLAITGHWEKESKTSRTIFYDDDGDEIEFNAGTTWVEVIPTDRDVEYN
ncbi:DUF3048 domain-containing protein [Patescibacteria group bacterium]|nr:DUF3048 domain-containing protein [Patescibacteria group bacterium]MBU0963744.1 DUF3048 domain-containing protein [Patescibacteria group bacterium]